MKALTKKLFRDVFTLRLQIFSMSVLITCGIAVLVASWSSYNSLTRAKNAYYDEYRFADIFAEFVRAPKNLVRSVQKIPSVELAEGRIVKETLIDVKNQIEPAVGRIISWSSSQLLNKIFLRQGRFPERGPSLEVLVHESFAKAHNLKPGDSLKLTIGGFQNKVLIAGIGLSPEYVYALNPVSSFPDNLHFGVIWMPIEDLERIANMQGAINNLIVRVQRKASLEFTKNEINKYISTYGGLRAYDRSGQISNLFVEDEIRQQKSMTTLVPGIFISVSTFILYTVLNRLIALQRSHIATLKSLGYPSESLVYYYWKLVSLISLFGIIPGLLFAWSIGQWYATLYEQYFKFPKIDFSLSNQAMTIGLIAGIIPNWLASTVALFDVFSLNPAEAMRPTVLQVLNTYFFRKKIFNPSRIQLKMVFRNILGKPWRSLFSIIGISAATAIIINGSFWSDVMNFIVDQQFRQLHREDIEIQLLHPQQKEVLTQLKNVQGVYLAQGFRTVAVKLSFNQNTKDTLLISVQSSEQDKDKNSTKESNTLKRLLTSSKKEILVPKSLVLLSEYFHRKFGIKKGDKITIQSSDLTSRPFVVTVAGFIDEIVGAAIYANKEDIHRWLNEEPTLNSIYLKIAPDQAQNMYVTLKKFPEVLSINNKKLTLISFQETLTEMINIFTVILMVFACAISAAVLFNMARISLSEKSWQLASLKILGYRNSEIFETLNLEIGLQVLLALAPGLLLGFGFSYLSTKMIHTDIFNFPLVIEIKTYAQAVVAIITLYFLTGIYLFKKTKSLNMTEALKERD